MAERQYTSPLIVGDGDAKLLHRLSFNDNSIHESELQQWIFEHPSLLPVRDIEPIFEDQIAVARELPTAAGPIDVFLVNSQGYITLVETKLWRNPEARRKVIAQIIDYAKELATWSYDDLVAAVKRATASTSKDPLFECVRDAKDDVDESQFIDQVSRSLKTGRFLLLIVGDGVHEGIELMTEFFQQTPQLGFTLALSEIALFELPDGKLLVQPRVIARTQEVVRAIVEIKGPSSPDDVSVTLPPETPADKGGGRRRLTEEEFLQTIGKVCDAKTEKFCRDTLGVVSDYNLDVSWGNSGPLFKYIHEGTGKAFMLGHFRRDGTFAPHGRGFGIFKEYNCEEVARKYMDALVSVIPSTSRREFSSPTGGKYQTIVYGNDIRPGARLPLAELVNHKDVWLKAVETATAEIDSRLDDQ